MYTKHSGPAAQTHKILHHLHRTIRIGYIGGSLFQTGKSIIMQKQRSEVAYTRPLSTWLVLSLLGVDRFNPNCLFDLFL